MNTPTPAALRAAMTKTQFAMLCGELLIDIGVALENENVRAALLAGKSYKEIRAIMETEF